MGILQKLKSLLGTDGAQSTTPTEPGVTVEREPSTETEQAVKGTPPAADDDMSSQDDPAGTDDEPAPEEPADVDESPSVEEIDGIGPTYAERLTDAGIETIADLAASDVETVAAATDASPSRVEDWVAQARDR